MTQEQKVLFKSLDIEIQCRLARRAYSLSIDLLDDFEYKELMKKLPITHSLHYTKWEDDDLTLIRPYLEKFGLEDKVISTSDMTDEQILLDKFMHMFGSNLSIAMVDTFNLVSSSFCPQVHNLCVQENLPTNQSAINSLKVDGWNITTYYDCDGLVLAHTRARNFAEATICTEQLRHILGHIKFPNLPQGVYIRVVGELALDENVLPLWREEYPGKPFINTRNSVSSVINNKVDVAKYKDYIYYFAFNISSTDFSLKFNTQAEVFEYLQQTGFMVPFYQVFDGTNFESYMQSFNYMESYYLNVVKPRVACDGTVLQSNFQNLQQDISPTRSGSFSNGMLAVKTGYWARKIYKTKILGFVYPESRVYNAVNIVVEPTLTEKNTTVTSVPINNLSRALGYGLRIGMRIKFSYHSDQIVEFEGVDNLEDEEE